MMTGSFVCRWAVRVRLAVVCFLFPERLFAPPPAFPFLLEPPERGRRPDPLRPDPLRDAVVPRAEPDLPFVVAFFPVLPPDFGVPGLLRDPPDEERRAFRFPPGETVVGRITSGGSSL
jgi:hypothetical protein